MRGVVRGAELAREQARERLHLVAPGEQRELPGVGVRAGARAAPPASPAFVPADLDELAGAALAAGLALQRHGQRAGEYCFMIPELPLAQMTPWFSGCSGLPSM